MTKKQAAAYALAAMVDELGDLEQATQPYRAQIARVDTLRKAVRAAFKDCDANANLIANGERWRACLGPAGQESTVDVLALAKLVGPSKFIAELASVTVTAIQKHCTADVIGAVVSTAQTGTRPLTLISQPEKHLRSVSAEV